MPDAGLEPILTRAQKRVFSGWALASAALAVGFLSGLSAVQFNVLALFNVCCPNASFVFACTARVQASIGSRTLASEHHVLCR
jgi:hypothetical protein